jgi:hypothetical protein
VNDRLILFATFSAVSLVFAQALFLHLACKSFGIPRSGFPRLLLASLAVDAIGAAGAGAAFLDIPPAACASIAAAALLAALLSLGIILRAPPVRAALAGTVFLALNALFIPPLAYLTLCESFQIPTGSGAAA